MGRYSRRERKLEEPSYADPIRSAAHWGRRLRHHRDAEGLRLEDLSEATLLGLRFLSELERGKRGASLQKAIEAANALGLEIMMVPRQHGERLRQHYRRFLVDSAAAPEQDAEQP